MDTRRLQHYLGHAAITNTVRYTACHRSRSRISGNNAPGGHLWLALPSARLEALAQRPSAHAHFGVNNRTNGESFAGI
jgi:hypothetical protein